MRRRAVAAAVCLSLLAAGGSAYCFSRAEALHQEGAWLLERSGAQAAEYVRRFEGAQADAQLRTFAERRAVLERAHLWRRGQEAAVGAAVLALLGAYGCFLLARLREQMVDAMGELGAVREPARPPL